MTNSSRQDQSPLRLAMASRLVPTPRSGTRRKHWVKPRPAAWRPFNETAGSGGGGFSRILLAVSGSPASDRAVLQVAAIAQHKSHVLVVHFSERLCLGRGGYWDLESEEDADRLLQGVRDQLASRRLSPEIWTDKSLAQITGQQIALLGHYFGADLIVIGRPRGRSPVWAVLTSSVSHQILHKSNIPVLIVP